MSGFYSYDDWKTTPPPDEDRDWQAEYEQRLEDQEQEEYERAAAECDERAPWPEPLDADELDRDDAREAEAER